MASIGIHGAGASSGGGATDATIVDPIGQDTMANSVSVVIASDQTPVPVEGEVDATIVAPLGQTTMAASIPVVLASDQSDLHTHTHPVTASGTLTTSGDTVTVALHGQSGVGARVVASGTLAGTIVMEASMDGTNYFSMQFVVVQNGGVVAGAPFVAGLFQGSSTHHFSAILPAGITHARVRLSTVSAGTAAVTINATAGLDFTQRAQGAYAQNPGPGQAFQIGGTASAGAVGSFEFVQVKAVNPGISASALGLVVVPWGLIDPGGSAGGYPWRLVGGRDPQTNAMRQMDLSAAALAGTGWNGVVVRPYPTSDGAGNSEPMKRNSDTAAYYRDGHQSPVALAFKVFHEPAANTQATITQASAGAGKRNVCTGITVTLASSGAAPAAVQIYVRLRDGATGAGTVLWSSAIALTAVAGAMVNIERNNIWIEGSQATAMTLEFSAAGGADTIETVSMEGVILTE